ncbi:MAG: LytTR family transcriptional regulator [Clostridia bacterium]|nr:LytTR family transcriptional regulator [Clostridia bacterium]
MRCRIIIDPQREEEVLIYTHEKTPLVESIERLAGTQNTPLVGYSEREIVPLSLPDVVCFAVEEGKVYALCGERRLLMKCRLYQLEGCLPMEFVKINQSCLANLRQVERFAVSIGGSLNVCFKNGHSDYVSRRQLKTVKEKVGMIV